MMGVARSPELRQTREMFWKGWGVEREEERRWGSQVRRNTVQDRNRISL